MSEKHQREIEAMDTLNGIACGRERVSIDGAMFQVMGIDVTRTPRFTEFGYVDDRIPSERAVYDVCTIASINLNSVTPVDSPNGFANITISGDVVFVSGLLKAVLVK